jgi:hypothetical protein
MMRSGRLLVEESPENLLGRHRLTSLEDVFLKLCMKDDSTVPTSQLTASTTSSVVALRNTDRISAQRALEGHVNMSFQHSTTELNVSQTSGKPLAMM